MILGVFGAIRVESRPTKCLTGDITSTLGGIRNVVVRWLEGGHSFRDHKRYLVPPLPELL